MPGVFITFEGIDGCGKTTVAEMVHDRLKKAGKEVVLTTEPTKTWLGDAVKRSTAEDHPALTEAFLFMADRSSHSKEISKWLEEGKIVLCDRYSDSTVCYQAASLVREGFEADPFEWLKEISDKFVLRPSLTIILDLEPEEALKRIQSREKMTKFETLDFLKSVRENFLRLAKVEDRIKVVGATPPLESVVEETMKVIEKILP
jgi:dTMP kinase